MAATQKPMTLDEVKALEHIFIGPTWSRNSDGGWCLPELTLGWEIAMWCTKWLRGMDGKAWKFTPEQLRFVLWWYAVDERGRFNYRTGVLQRMKGWGKDPLLAVISLVELVGPSRPAVDPETGYIFRHQGGPLMGLPIGKAHPQAWVQVTAVSQTQTETTMSMFPLLMTDEFIAHFNIKPGAELIRAHGGKQRLQAVTSSYRAIEGKRTTFTLKNETHHWVTGNDGHKMSETIDGNATKMASRWLSITNAYLPGEDSVAEREREAWQKVQDGLAVDNRMLYDSIEANPLTPLTPEALEVVVPIIRGDAVWLSVEDIILSVLQTHIAPSRSRRMYLNQIVAAEDALFGPQHWGPLERRGARLEPGDEIVMGFDGGKTDDSTVLVAIRVKDRVAFLLHHQQRPDNWPTGEGAPGWEVDRTKVDSAVHEAFKAYKVRGFYCDTALWESYIDDWAEAYGKQMLAKAPGGHPMSWDMRASLKRSTLANEALMRSIFDQKLFHDGNPILRLHLLNARRRTNNYGVSFGKESRESPRKVDAYAALLLAHEALRDLRVRGKQVKEHTGEGFFL